MAARSFYAPFYAPITAFVPPPEYVVLPPIVTAVPWLGAPVPYASPPQAAVAPPYPSPEELLAASVPPPIVVLPPQQVLIASGPPPIIYAPPDYALSVWPALFIVPPLLAIAVLHDNWWTGRYRGRGGYFVGGAFGPHYGPGFDRGSNVRFGRVPGVGHPGFEGRGFGQPGAGRPGFVNHDGGSFSGPRPGFGGGFHGGGLQAGGFHGGAGHER